MTTLEGETRRKQEHGRSRAGSDRRRAKERKKEKGQRRAEEKNRIGLGWIGPDWLCFYKDAPSRAEKSNSLIDWCVSGAFRVVGRFLADRNLHRREPYAATAILYCTVITVLYVSSVEYILRTEQSIVWLH